MSRLWRRSPDDPPRPGIAVYPGHGHEIVAGAQIPDRPAEPPAPPPPAGRDRPAGPAGTGRLRGTLAGGQVEPAGDLEHPILAGLRRELAGDPDGLSADQQIRAIALQAAARLVAGSNFADDGLLLRDVEQMTVGAADRLAEWIRDGVYGWDVTG